MSLSVPIWRPLLTCSLRSWYNVPPSSSEPVKGDSTSPTTNGSREVKAEDSTPLNFDTFVPTHDPTLAAGSQASQVPGQSNGYPQSYLPAQGSNGTLASRDEAFEKALNAMYWTGYWTAVYHVRISLGALCSSAADHNRFRATDASKHRMEARLRRTRRTPVIMMMRLWTTIWSRHSVSTSRSDRLAVCMFAYVLTCRIQR